ncbi:unnamed protein product [Meloidogyne enterolobii]|uniref:Uncharacterized protein n=1 Tax=Meloidogyne enterolobii TaxID=390850 RepID=A0ACB0Y7X8_MELEN
MHRLILTGLCVEKAQTQLSSLPTIFFLIIYFLDWLDETRLFLLVGPFALLT